MPSPLSPITVNILDRFHESSYITVDFDYLLNDGETVNIFQTNYRQIVESSARPLLLTCILEELFTPRAGVKKVRVDSFSIDIHASRAVTSEELVEHVLLGIEAAGYIGVNTTPT